jgi:hypothetical protein
MAEKLRSRFKKVYPLAYNTVYVIVNKKEDTDKESILELLGSGDISVETEILGQDFGSLEEFLAQ